MITEYVVFSDSHRQYSVFWKFWKTKMFEQFGVCIPVVYSSIDIIYTDFGINWGFSFKTWNQFHAGTCCTFLQQSRHVFNSMYTYRESDERRLQKRTVKDLKCDILSLPHFPTCVCVKNSRVQRPSRYRVLAVAPVTVV